MPRRTKTKYDFLLILDNSPVNRQLVHFATVSHPEFEQLFFWAESSRQEMPATKTLCFAILRALSKSLKLKFTPNKHTNCDKSSIKNEIKLS